MTTLLDTRPDLLAQLLQQAWKATPAATARRWSAGRWQRQPHLNMISDAVSEIAERPLRLIVSLPPRHGKSELLSHWLEVWYLANWPDKRIGLASYAHGFAATWGRKVRNTIRDNPEIGVEISRDQSIGHNWQTSEEGGMMTSGVGGPFTGRGFDLLIIDDPIKNRLDANSPRIRQRIWDWWTSTARTRLEPGGSAIVVMTRWHEDDLVGRLLDPPDDTAEGDVWEHIRLPALAEEDDPLGREEGAPLWPDRYGADALAALRIDVGPNDFAGLFQQRPVERGGGLFKSHWWRFVDELPTPTGDVIQFWDTAFKTGQENDYSVCGTFYPADAEYTLKSVYRERLEFPELLQAIVNQAAVHQPRRIYVEDAASGQSVVQQLKRTTKLPIIAMKVDGDKVARANAVTGLVEAGKVALPAGAEWLPVFLDEVTAFPGGSFDDQVDMLSGGLAAVSRPVPRVRVAR